MPHRVKTRSGKKNSAPGNIGIKESCRRGWGESEVKRKRERDRRRTVGWIQLLGEQYRYAVIVCSTARLSFPGVCSAAAV